MPSSYRLSLENFLKNLDVKTQKVVDIGGSQLPVKGRTKSWDVAEYVIADLEDPHVDSPKPDIILDLNKTSTYTDIPCADIVFCLEVFEYIWNPAAAMKTINKILNSKGTAWVTFPSFYPMHNPIEHDALRYMPGGIQKLAKASGLTIKQMIPRRPETTALQNFFSIERLRAAKGQDHAFMGWIVEFTK